MIHTVSYELSGAINHGAVGNKDRFTDSLITQRYSPEPHILIGPNFVEGIDLPDDQCRFIIIAKLPIPRTDGLIRCRMQKDPRYIDKIVVKAIVQMMGRGTRSETDWCEIFCPDVRIIDFLSRNKDLIEHISMNGRIEEGPKFRPMGTPAPPPSGRPSSARLHTRNKYTMGDYK